MSREFFPGRGISTAFMAVTLLSSAAGAAGDGLAAEKRSGRPKAAAATRSGPEAWPRVRIEDRFLAAEVRQSLAGASDWLREDACQVLLSQFKDQRGRPLHERLRDLEQDAPGYLGLLIFVEESPSVQCRKGETLAFTTPGSRVVYVCGERFQRVSRTAPWRGRGVLIHEALHTLGLGENPPSTQFITETVLYRCRQ